MSVTDIHNRQIDYLRLSVTDRCNLRCRYCVPHNGLASPRRVLLSLEELFRLARHSALLGIRKIRITGGEPLLRPGIIPFLERIREIPGIGEVVLTTNGTLLKKMAGLLRQAGVRRLNISLDSLKGETFAAMTGGGDLHSVLDGIAAAQRVGFPAPQINVVVLRGVNDGEIPDFASMAADTGLTVRFIEYMPLNGDCHWNSLYVNCDEILEQVTHRYRLTPLIRMQHAGPARYFQLDDGPGKIGVISPVSKHFCESCDRIRITADGIAHGCLFSSDSVDLKPFLWQGDDAVRRILMHIMREKPLRHNLSEGVQNSGFIPMSAIGG